MDEKMQYQRLLNKLIDSRNTINSCVGDLNNAINAAGNGIVLNGTAYKGRELEDKKNMLESMNGKLNNVFIPYVRAKITELEESE